MSKTFGTRKAEENTVSEGTWSEKGGKLWSIPWGRMRRQFCRPSNLPCPSFGRLPRQGMPSWTGSAMPSCVWTGEEIQVRSIPGWINLLPAIRNWTSTS
jgi:hypothetical protein